MVKNSEITKWISIADRDYIAARFLILNDLVVQGAFLSNTAIEKYLKAICVAKDISFKEIRHDTPKLYDKVSKAISRDLEINQKYLDLIYKCYEGRYFDKLKPGKNIAFSAIKMLVELDYSVFQLRGGFDLKKDLLL